MTPSRPLLFFYCQHSLGMGHFIRSSALAERLVDSFDVVFFNGGAPPAGVPFPSRVERIDLPPLGMRDDGGLLSLDPRLDVGEALARRRSVMLEMFGARRPRVLLIELFPFGRRKFEPELLPLLDAAHTLGPARPVIACSVRDLLVTARASQQRFDDRAQLLCDRYFDVVLVHADEAFAAFTESFQPAQPLRVPIRYTGFLTRPEACDGTSARSGLVVSAGGGQVGEPLFRASVEAHRANWPTTGLETTIVAGPFAPSHVVEELSAESVRTDGLRVLPHVGDLGALLARARASVSQCGYNTMLDLVRSSVPALVVPFADGRENEQTRRAERLADRGLVRWLPPAELTGDRLALEIRALLEFAPRPAAFSLDGAAASAHWLSAQLAEGCHVRA